MTDRSHLRFREGDIVYIRKLQLNDVDDRYVSWVNDPEITQYMQTGTFPSSQDDVEAYVAQKNQNDDILLLAIVAREDDVHIGNIKLGPIDWVRRNAELSILIGEKDYWGRGMGTEAIELTTQYAFNKLNLHKIYAGCYSNNDGMIQAFKKAGFEEEGSLVEHGVCEGEFIDIIRFGCIKETSAESQE